MYNPCRGRDTYTRQSGGGTRYARLPPVIEIIPLSGYVLPHTWAYRIYTLCTTPIGVEIPILANPVVALATLAYHRLSK